MKMRYRRNFARNKMVRAFYKGWPIAIESINNPITRSFLEFFHFTPIRVPWKKICGKELKKVQQ